LSQLNRLLSTLDYWRFHETGVEKNLRVSGQLRYNSGHALVDAALKGLGIVQLPDYYVDQHLQTGAPCSLLELQREAKEGIRAVYPANCRRKIACWWIISPSVCAQRPALSQPNTSLQVRP